MLKARGGLLTASLEERILRYRLLPFGEPGSTNKGKILASSGSVEVPAEPLPVNLEHDYTRPVGSMEAEETPDGLEATVHVAKTRAGDDVLEEAAAGLRAGISVEIDNPVIRAGKLIAGKLSGAGLVVKPAYPSALLMAADFGEKDADEDEDDVPEEDAEAATAELEEAKSAIDAGDLETAAARIADAIKKLDTESTKEESTEVPEQITAASTASPQAMLASFAAMFGNGDQAQGAAPKNELTLDKFAASFRSASDMTDGKLKAAALDTITQADVYDETAQPAYLGELWAKTEYDEIFTPLVSHENLTGMKVTGWRWEEGVAPIVDDWEPAFSGVAPDEEMTDIPTSEMVAKSKDFYAKRIAGGNRFDRVHFDFPVPGVLESFLLLQTDYIKRRRDLRTKQEIVRAAKSVEGTGKDVENAWRRIILGAMHCMEYAKPTYALVGNDVYRELLGTDMLENLAMLETTLGLESGSMAGFRIQPAFISDTSMNGKTIVGAGKSTVLHEPAGAPFRVDAQELAKGAVDKAVFSYYLLRSDDRGGIYDVSAAL